MNNIKKLTKGFIIITAIFLILSSVITVLNYFNVINHKNIIMFLTVIFGTFIGGFWIGKQSIKKGWLEGLKLSILIALVMTIITIILNKFTVSYFLYLLIIIGTCIFGSMLGINKK